MAKRGGREPRRTLQIDRYTKKVIGTYDSLVQAAVSVSGAVTAIYSACNGRAKTAYGYMWRYADW